DAHVAEVLLPERSQEARAMGVVLLPLRVGRTGVDLGVRRRLVDLRDELAALERHADVGVEAEVLVRREHFGAEPAPAVLDAYRRLLFVIRPAGKLGAETALVVVGVVLRNQAPVGRGSRSPAHAAEHA